MKKLILIPTLLPLLLFMTSCQNNEKDIISNLKLETNLEDKVILEGEGEYKSNTNVSISCKAYLGYDFLGWYNNNQKISDELNYEFKMPKNDVTYIAKFELDSDLSNFEFTSDYDNCNITNIINKNFKNIIVPSYVTYIKEGLLNGCSNVETLSIPFVDGENKDYGKGIIYPLGYIFGTEPFEGASYVNQLYRDTVVTEDSYNSTLGSKGYYIPDSLNEVSITNSKLLPSYAFSRTNIEILRLKNIKKIDSDALEECENLEKVYYEDSLSNFSIIDFKEYSLFGNYDLYYKENDNYHLFDDELIIPNNVEIISDNMFLGYANLININFGPNIKYIGEDVFRNCINLENIYFDGTIDEWINIDFCDYSSSPLKTKMSSNTSILKHLYVLDDDGDITYNNKKYKLINDIETSLKIIKNGSFYGYENLNIVKLNEGVEKIEEDAFALSSMKELYIPSSVTYIDEEAFDNCKNLKLIHNYSNIDITIEKYGLEEDCVITKE